MKELERERVFPSLKRDLSFLAAQVVKFRLGMTVSGPMSGRPPRVPSIIAH